MLELLQSKSLFEKDSCVCIFFEILRIFLENLFGRISPDVFVCVLPLFTVQFKFLPFPST